MPRRCFPCCTFSVHRTEEQNILLSIILLVALPAIAFFVGRTTANWLHPRLQVYGRLAVYLRVMWIPIGGFAVGYLTIIVVFAGLYGALDRFFPGAFLGSDQGIAGWLAFAFSTALCQDTLINPDTAAARVLVGFHLILSAGWGLVLFAAVMSYIGPKLDRVAQRHAGEDGD